MRIELKRLHRRIKKTFVYVTHDQTSAMILGDRIAFLSGKKIQQIAPPAELYLKPENLEVAKFLGFPPLNVLTAEEFNRLPAPSPPKGTWRVGIRPEHIHILDDAGGPFEVEWVQEVGYARYANFKIGALSICGKCEDRVDRAGQRIDYKFIEKYLMFFDKDQSLIHHG
ncbi:MAG: hypothetical protein ACE5GQ_03840 [Nitrospinales bacterium]